MMPIDNAQIRLYLLEKINSIEDAETLTMVMETINNILARNKPKSKDQIYELDLPQTVAREASVYEEP